MKAIARLRQPERSRLGEGESWRTLLRATVQGDAGLSVGDASLPEGCKRRRLEFGEDDGPGRRRLDACCDLEPAKRLEVRGLAAPQAGGLARTVVWKASGAGRSVCVGVGVRSRVGQPGERAHDGPLGHAPTPL